MQSEILFLYLLELVTYRYPERDKWSGRHCILFIEDSF
jgi:hypothetical protein